MPQGSSAGSGERAPAGKGGLPTTMQLRRRSQPSPTLPRTNEMPDRYGRHPAVPAMDQCYWEAMNSCLGSCNHSDRSRGVQPIWHGSASASHAARRYFNPVNNLGSAESHAAHDRPAINKKAMVEVDPPVPLLDHSRPRLRRATLPLPVQDWRARVLDICDGPRAGGLVCLRVAIGPGALAGTPVSRRRTSLAQCSLSASPHQRRVLVGLDGSSRCFRALAHTRRGRSRPVQRRL